MENEVITAPVESVADETAPIETTPATQVVEKPQATNNDKVDIVDNKPQVQDSQRNRPSNYYRERERIRKMEAEIALLREEQARFKESNKPKPEINEKRKLTVDELLADPEAALSAREQRYLSEIQNIREEIGQFKNERVNNEKMNAEREALEMLFPKSSPDANEPLEQRIHNDERVAVIEELFRANPGLDRLMRIAPKEAAELALLKLTPAKPQTSPKAINKSLMGTTQRGNPGPSRIVSLDDKMSELNKLKDEMSKRPELRFDKDHKAKRDKLMKDVESMLVKEKGDNK